MADPFDAVEEPRDIVAVFACEVLCAGAKKGSESRKYHAPLAPAAINAAAIPIQIPFPLPPAFLGSSPLLSSSVFPNIGAGGAYLLAGALFAVASVCFCGATGSADAGDFQFSDSSAAPSAFSSAAGA